MMIIKYWEIFLMVLAEVQIDRFCVSDSELKKHQLQAARSSSPVKPAASLSEEEIEADAKIGSRVKVTAPLKVYHVNRVPEVYLEGMEGKLKDYVAVWKGKRISANIPYKVEFFRGNVKFVAHLKEDEFVFIDL
ncbi:unnamed protein product [Eruca vesicaria subsp. sativa]|uniref:Ferredoxin thioredoxin reductase alpha chain domain-containing protein n=1 Tax=Eruca vesicaria subsp. sativa TaxID=29727 RepID=A0ABC8L0U4_ERUVS|nr:unnamed protein product [Eruca vesicaria subsp. sativa]